MNLLCFGTIPMEGQSNERRAAKAAADHKGEKSVSSKAMDIRDVAAQCMF